MFARTSLIGVMGDRIFIVKLRTLLISDLKPALNENVNNNLY